MLNWKNFKTYDLDSSKAFESFCNQVFEQYIRNKYEIRRFTPIRGDGGDGGVESYAELFNGDVIAIQAKWLPRGLTASGINQVKNSIDTAMRIRPSIKEYIVCIPINLTSSKMTRSGKTANTEENKWNNLKGEIEKCYPGLSLILWTNHDLMKLIQLPSLEGAHKFWFDREIITLSLLQEQFEKSKESWLKEKYIPDLHTSGKIYQESRFLWRDESLREEIITEANKILNFSEKLKKEINLYQMISKKHFSEKGVEFKKFLDETICYLKDIIKSIESGSDISEISLEIPDYSPSFLIDSCEQELSCENRNHAEKINDFIVKFFNYDSHFFRKNFVKKWNNCLRIIIGGPGTGKTHALANIVETLLSEEFPCLLIRTKSCGPPSSWKVILQNALGIGSDWSEKEIFLALEARAHLFQIKKNSELGTFEKLSCFLICIDGLDEVINNRDLWWDRMNEIKAISKAHPRLRFIFSARAHFFDQSHSKTSFSKEEVIELKTESDIPVHKIFNKYMQRYGINIIETSWFRWSLSSLRELKLFCLKYKNKKLNKADSILVTIGYLISDSIEKIEEDIHSVIAPIRMASNGFKNALAEISYKFFYSDKIEHGELVEILKNEIQLSNDYIHLLIENFINHGLLVKYEEYKSDPLDKSKIYYYPASQQIIEFLIARNVAEKINSGISLPANMRNENEILKFVSIILFCQYKKLPGENELWVDIFSSEKITEFRCVALLYAPIEDARPFREWVRNELKASMPRSRFIQKYLCYPLARIPNHPLGSILVDEVLKEFKRPADRDIIWSSIDDMPGEVGNPWAGYGHNSIQDEIYDLNEYDKFDGLPLLHAWNLTSVNNSIVNRCKENLTRWGGVKF